MALFNYASKEITIKIVYYGPGLSGKTTNLQYLHSVLDPSKRGKLISLATEADRTLFFDFLPVALGKIGDFSLRFQLYTVPGQVRYNATRKLVLKGADAVVFVADSQHEMREQNLESIRNMRENLIANNINTDDIPLLLQFNKRDLPNIASVEELNRYLNEDGKHEYREAIAINGTGVEETFQRINHLVMKGIAEKHNIKLMTHDDMAEAPGYVKPAGSKSALSVSGVKPPGSDPASFAAVEPAIDFSGKARYQDEPVVSQITPASLENAYKSAGDVPFIPKEKVELLDAGIRELSQTLKDLKNVLYSIQSDIKDLKKEQKEAHTKIKDVTMTLNNIKTKRRWFTFL